MGNKIARTTQVSATEYYLHDLPSSYNLVLKEVLGRGRFFKSILCKHDEGLVLVKVYFKRGDSIDLREYERRLVKIKDVFLSLEHPHVWPFQFWQETDKAAYLVRQYFFSNLHDRLSTRPFLSLVEKKWLAFQLLLAVKQCHEKGICHGDIKCENVLVTSWNWLYLADFASFKPTYIPYDDPSDFSFFYDTRERRLCYLAPERFYEHGGETKVAQNAPLKPSMDIFSVGCVIAELFLEGQPLFELAQLLAYRRGQHDPSQHLEKIPDPGIRKMILHMIQLEPEARLSAENYLQNYVRVIFPNYFSPFLHTLYCCSNPLPSDMRVATCQGIIQEILKKMMENKPGDEMGVDSPLPSHPVNASKVHETFLSHRQYLEISREVKPTEKKTIPEPPSISFSSLPHEIAEDILARVSRWKYPRLSLVSKSFHSLLSSTEIYKTRSQIGANETCVYICLELPDQPCARWFSLWTNPDKTRTKRTGTKTRFKRDSSGNSVLQIPFSSSPSAPLPYDTQTVGSEIYIIGGPHKKPSSSVRILDCKSQTWRDAPNMTVARENAATALVDDKIYVVGGCNIDAYSTNWIEVFDITSQSWTALPGPDSLVDDELPDDDDYCNIVNVFEGKIYLTIDEKDYTYDSKDDTWKLVKVETSFLSSVKVWWEMENVLYCCTDLGYLMWSGCEIEGREWREIKGLNKLRKHLKTGNEIEMVKYGAKLLVMWHSYPDLCMGNKIWYAKICLESRCNGGEVWGKVECVDVLTFPVESFANFYCLTASV